MAPEAVGRFEAWVIARREHHYDARPRRHWIRYNAFEFVASLMGRDDIYSSRHD